MAYWMYSAVKRPKLANGGSLNAKGYSERTERRILHALGRGLLKEFPNPERVGCPGADILKRITSHEMPLSEAEKWLDHLTSCGPCYADFKRLQEAHEWRRRRMLLVAAAGILLAAAVTGWAVLHRWSANLTAQTAILDLRDRSISRGTEANPGEPPLEIERTASHVRIYLPLGSSDGDYGVRISGYQDRVLFSTNGIASTEHGITSLVVEVNLSSASPGVYLLQLENAGSGWASYPLRVK